MRGNENLECLGLDFGEFCEDAAREKIQPFRKTR